MTPTDTDGWIILLFWLFSALSVILCAVCVPLCVWEYLDNRKNGRRKQGKQE